MNAPLQISQEKKSKNERKNGRKGNFVSECSSERPKTTTNGWKECIKETNSANLFAQLKKIAHTKTHTHTSKKMHNSKWKFYYNILVGMRFYFYLTLKFEWQSCGNDKHRQIFLFEESVFFLSRSVLFCFILFCMNSAQSQQRNSHCIRSICSISISISPEIELGSGCGEKYCDYSHIFACAVFRAFLLIS